MTSKSSKMKSSMVAPLLWVVGLVIGALASAGIAGAQFNSSQHLFIVILVLMLFMGMVSCCHCILNKGAKDNYEVNDAEKGKENVAYDTTAETETKKNGELQSQPGQPPAGQEQNGTTPNASGDEKWVSNYVPFGDYPKGNIVYVKEDGAN